ncbi:MAG: hypothetical protein WC558_01370 [Patulibacter sp.]
MFNALRTDELLLGIARILRRAAASEGPLDGFERSLALSATSVARLLASEQRALPGIETETRRRLDLALAADARPLAVASRAQIAQAPDAAALGEVLTALLADLPRPDPLRSAVQGALRWMADAEVAALAAGPEGVPA